MVNIYRTLANGSTYYLEDSLSATTIPLTGSGTYYIVGVATDAQLVTQQVAPIANSTAEQKVNLSSIPTDPTGSATSRNIYRTKAGTTALLLDHILA